MLFSEENTFAYTAADSDFKAHDLLYKLRSSVCIKLWYLIAQWAPWFGRSGCVGGLDPSAKQDDQIYVTGISGHSVKAPVL